GGDEAGEEVQYGGFSSTGRPDQADRLAGREPQRDPVEDGARTVERERDALERGARTARPPVRRALRHRLRGRDVRGEQRDERRLRRGGHAFIIMNAPRRTSPAAPISARRGSRCGTGPRRPRDSRSYG